MKPKIPDPKSAIDLIQERMGPGKYMVISRKRLSEKKI
jgi:hypothetical protein